MTLPQPFTFGKKLIEGQSLDESFANPGWSTPGVAVAAKIGGTQATSPLLVETVNAISATAAGGVLLPRPLLGRIVVLQNTSNYAVTVFVVDDCTIDGASGATGFSLPALTTIVVAGQVVSQVNWDILIQNPAPASKRFYGSFYSTASQTNLASVNKMTLNQTVSASGFSVQSNSHILAAYAGVYNIQFSAQVSKTGANDTIDIWLMKNNQNVDWSNTSVYIQTSSQKFVAAWNWMIPLNAGDYVEIAWNSANAAMQLLAQAASAPMPEIPSVIVTVQSV